MSDRSNENYDEIWIIREMNILTIATWTLEWEVSRGETLSAYKSPVISQCFWIIHIHSKILFYKNQISIERTFLS